MTGSEEAEDRNYEMMYLNQGKEKMREKDEEVAKVDETTQDSDRKVPEENAVLGELNFL